MTGYKYHPNDPDAISLNAVTAVGAGSAIPFNDLRQVNWLVKGEGTIDGGIVRITSSDDQDDTGEWNELDRVDAVTLSGKKRTGNTYPAPPGFFVRGEILEEITGGGNITVVFNGLQG